jgi:hypothetical protein
LATIKPSLVLAFVCLVLLVGSAPCFASTSELLYVRENNNVDTYSVNNTTAVTKKLGSLATGYKGVVWSINRAGSFVYILGTNADFTQEYFTVYALTAAGVPTGKPIQTLYVKPAIRRLYIHPNGTIAYGMFWWAQYVNGVSQFASDVVLFTINPKTGQLTNTKKVVANFPLNPNYSTTLFGMNGTGTKLYSAKTLAYGPDSSSGTQYSYSTINAKTGMLGGQVPFWFDNAYPEIDYTVFSDALIAEVHNETYNPGQPNEITISSNSDTPNTLITCTAAYVQMCGDNNAGLWMHPSGKYIFVKDESTYEEPILYISTALKRLVPSGSSIPGGAYWVAFSADGLLVFAVENNEILVYVFNPHTGLLTARTSIAVPTGVQQTLPWQ